MLVCSTLLRGFADSAQVRELNPERHGVAAPYDRRRVLGDSFDGCDQHLGQIAPEEPSMKHPPFSREAASDSPTMQAF